MKKRLILITLTLMLISALALVCFTGCDLFEKDKEKTSTSSNGNLKASEGLHYRLKNDDTYEVFSLGNCNDETLVIPATYNGKAVTSIADGAFEDEKQLTSIIISEGITSIGEAAFDDCDNVTAITLPNSLTSVGEGAFPRLPKRAYAKYEEGSYLGNSQNPYLLLAEAYVDEDQEITDLAIHKDTKIIAAGAIAASSFTSCVIPSSVIFIGEFAFGDVTASSIVLPAHLKTIEEFTFDNVNIREITIGAEVQKIKYRAFCIIDSLTIHYLGTVAQWNAIEKDDDWRDEYDQITVQCTDGIA